MVLFWSLDRFSREGVAGDTPAFILVLTTRDGWKNANEQLIAIFAVVSVAAVAFGAAPSVFKYDLETNKLSYANCANIQSETVTYAVTYQPGKTSKEPDVFLREIDLKLSGARKFGLGFDPTKLPSPIQISKGITGQ